MQDDVSLEGQAWHLTRVGWFWTPIMTLLFWPPWCVILFFDRVPRDLGLIILSVMFVSLAGIVGTYVRAPLNANFRRLATFYRVHAEANEAERPIALLLRSFDRVHGYHDAQTGFSIFWLLDEALRETGFQPVLLGTGASLPDDHGTLMFPTGNDTWQAVFETFGEAAAVIIVFPEMTDSLQTEMRLLRERGWLAKSVALMTPASVRVPNAGMEPGIALGGNDGERSERWEEARQRLSRTGLDLPPYDADGALIEWSATGAVDATSGLSFEVNSFGDKMDAIMSPRSQVRRRSFCRTWRAVHVRRGFNGKSIGDTYPPIAPQLPDVTFRDTLNPPGSDDSVRSGIWYLVYLGWMCPIALTILSFML